MITVKKRFDASASRVWTVLTDPEEMRSWYFYIRDFKPEEGTVFTFYEKEEGGSFLHRCEVLKVLPERLLEHSWEHPSHSSGKSVVSWMLQPLPGNRAELTLVHRGVESFSDGGPEFSPENYQAGWEQILGRALRNHLYGTERLVFEIEIRAPRSRVWEALWSHSTYGDWTHVFDSGSHYEGQLRQGGRVRLLSGSGAGMYRDIASLKENEELVFSHIGLLDKGTELPVDAETEKWTGCLEGYYLSEVPAGTRLRVEVDSTVEHVEVMKEKFPLALERLKEICETQE